MELLKLYDNLIGRPFKWRARGPDSFDCFGLCAEIYKRLGYYLPPVNYPADLDPGQIDDWIKSNENYFKRIEAPAAHCLVTFSLKPPWVSHIGVLTADKNHFIHASRRHRVYIQRLNKYWRQRIAGFYIYDTAPKL